MDPERHQLESSSTGTVFETPGQQCLPNWETGRTTSAGYLPVSVGSNFGGNTFPLAEFAVGRRADSEITTPPTASTTVFLQVSRKPKDKKIANEESSYSTPVGKEGSHRLRKRVYRNSFLFWGLLVFVLLSLVVCLLCIVRIR